MKKTISRKGFCFGFILLMSLLFWGPTHSMAASNLLSAEKLIANAYESGELDYESYINYSLYTIFAPDKLPENFRSEGPKQIIKSATSIIEEALRDPYLLNDDNRHILYRPAGPTDSGDSNYYGAGIVVWSYNTPGGHFKIWYTEDNANGDAVAGSDGVEATVPQYVIDFGAYHDNVWTTETGTMNYNEPASDDGEPNNGGDGLFDVYIINMASYGYCSHFCDDPVSYIVVENDYTGFPANDDPDDQKGAMKVTAAHEFHHAIQNNYNDHCAAGSDLTWYKEATSTWMEDQVYDAVNDNLMYVDNFLDAPETSLNDSTDKGYGDWIFNEFLETKFDSDTVRLIWAKIESLPTDKAIDAISAVLVDKGSKLKDAFTEFCGKNYAQKGFYKDALKWKCSTGDDIKIENRLTPHELDYSTATSHEVTEQIVNIDHLASKYYKFIPGSSLKKPAMLTITVNGTDGKDVNAIAIAKKKDGSFVEYPFTLDDVTKEGEVAVSGFSSENITEVVLVLVNYSKTEDSLEIRYEAQLMKGFVFVIDDTGSMGAEIAAAKAAANKVLDDNKAAGVKRCYTLISFKDGSGVVKGQSSDEDKMKGYVNALTVSGGSGCPESSLLSIRQAAGLSEGADIMMMTDASSNSYGVDDTYATWGEVYETIFKLLNTNSRLHSIIYGSDCLREEGKSTGQSASFDDESGPVSFGAKEYADGSAGYNMISTESGGLYFRIPTGETETAVEVILRTSTSDSTIAYYDGEGANTYTVPVDSTVTQLQIVLNGNTGSSVTMEVQNPSAVVVTDATDGVSVLQAGGSTFYQIEGAAFATGSWTASITGTGTYRFSAEGSTTNPMDYTGDTSCGVGNTLSMEANIIETLTGICFELVKSDGSDSTPVTLTSSDGLSYTGTQVMNTVGSYRFKVTGDGNFQRMYSAKITVGSLDVIAPSPKDATPDSSFTHTFQIKNLGTEEATYNIFASSSMGWDDLSGIPESVTVSAGGTENIAIPVSVPNDATAGQIDTLSLQAVNQSDPLINDTNETETRVVAVAEDYALYFPHIATTGDWETQICIINTTDGALSGILTPYDNDGVSVSEGTEFSFPSHGRREITVSSLFTSPDSIGYIVFVPNSEGFAGYTKFYTGKYRVAVPAVSGSEINTGDIYISHIASDSNWCTGISLLNTTSLPKTLTIEFDNGQTKTVSLAANEHKAVSIRSLFGGLPQSEIKSAVVKDASGVIGLELFINNALNLMSGILLKDDTATKIYYPHVASGGSWTTGIVAYNPSDTSCDMTITPYTAAGVPLTTTVVTISGKEKYIGAVSALGLPANTAWLQIEATSPITGFELFIQTDQMGGYTGVGISGTEGVFAKLEKDGWTGIAFVNIEEESAKVDLIAYDDNGNIEATESINVGGHSKVANTAEGIFTQFIGGATYIKYSSDKNVVGFQLNGSTNGMMLDGLPGM